MFPQGLKIEARRLRSTGKTYSEINEALCSTIPKSTLSEWCRGIKLPYEFHQRVVELNRLNFKKARVVGTKIREEKRQIFFEELRSKNGSLMQMFECDSATRKIALVVLYLAEGSKTPRGSLMFGNSDPFIISLFVKLMRECYDIDESKFRCTLQCRADQNIKMLEKFWSETTCVPLKQFYGARVDKRTVGKISRKVDYKGVCRIDYFSSAIDLELKYIAQMIKEKLK